MLKQKIIAAGLALILIVTAHFFMTAYDVYVMDRDTLKILTDQLEGLEGREEEQGRKKHILERVDNFVIRAGSLGLARNQWSYYDVNIEEAISFKGAEQILRQTANSPSYYFKPDKVYIKTKYDVGDEGDQSNEISPPTGTEQMEDGDILLTLKGTFIVSVHP